MAAPLSSKERVSQLVHGERRGEKGGVAGDPRCHSDNSQNPPERVLAPCLLWHSDSDPLAHKGEDRLPMMSSAPALRAKHIE